MDGEKIFGIVIMCFTCLMCAGIFYGIGLWAQKRKDPAHFYAGSTVDPKTVSDVPAYNRANAKMWKCFSMPFWMSAGCALGSIWMDQLMTAAIVVESLACTVGIGWLICKYNQICKIYMIR